MSPTVNEVTSVVHPPLEPWEYDGLQDNVGWILPIELIDGEAVVMPPTGDAPSYVQGELFYALRRWHQRAGTGKLRQDMFLRLPRNQRVAPDIVWWSDESQQESSWQAPAAIPDLVVEVLSPSTRDNDVGPKRRIYMESGVKELWLVDPDARSITRVRPGQADKALSGGSVLRSDLLPGFELRVADVFPA